MQFQSVGVLLWFLPVAGFIILLYLLKVRRREVRVPARFLFPAITTDVRANALIQKLRPNVLMFLQLLMALLLLLALARPMMLAKGLPGQSVVVIDTSASMGARESNTTRFEQARSELRALIRDLNPSEQMAIVEAGAQVRVVAPLTNDKQKLLSAVDNLRVSHTANNLDEALRLASALVGKSEQGRIVLMSDGAFPPIADFSAGSAKLSFRSFGNAQENLAVVAMDVQETARGWEWFVNLRNFGTRDAKAVLEFYSGGNLVDAREVTIPAGQSLGQTLTLQKLVEPLEVRLDANDALDVDNRAYRVGATQRPKRILLVGEGNFFLERALTLEPNVELFKANSVPEAERAEQPGGSEFDLVIFDGTTPVNVKARSVLVIGAQGGPIAKREGKVNLPRIASWEREHPLLRFVELGSVLIDNSARITPAPCAKVLAESQQTPLIVAGDHRGRRWVGIAWNLMESDFPLQPGFPIFVANLLEWLTDEPSAKQGFTVNTGIPFSITLEPTERRVELSAPDGSVQTYEPNEGALVIPGLSQVGLYQLKTSKGTIPISANLFNSDESNLAPRTQIELGGKVVQAEGSLNAMRDLWRPFIWVMLAVLLVEWWVYVRRS